MPPSVVVVAAIQAAPIYMNLERSLARALDLIAEAAKRRAQLVVFPESWLPGYPAWLDVCRDVAVWDNQQMKRLYAQLHENSVVVPGKVTEALGEAAKRHNLTLVIGVQERVADGAGRGTLYNSVLTFGPDGELLNCHRKLVPTFNERLIWGQGDGSSLRSVETPIGRIGSLICWEHWMPLVRQKLHIDGEDIHVALWPSVKEMHQIASRQYAFEGRCFVVAAGGIMRYSDLPREFEPISSIQGDDNEFILNGGSAVIGPDGQYVAGPSFGSEVIILARINLARIREESMTLDVTGHFNRPDLFDFRFKGASELDQPGQVEILSQTGPEFTSSQSAEALRSTGTESISPLAPEAVPSLRVVSLNRDAGWTGGRNSGFDSSDVQQIENKA